MPDTDDTQRVMFAPDGALVTSMLVHCVSGVRIEQISDGNEAEQSHFDDFPSFEDYINEQIVIDDNGSDWLARHCRVILADKDDDIEAEEVAMDPWDPVVQDHCRRLMKLTEAKHVLNRGMEALPHGFSDAIVGTVMEQVVVGRIDTEIADLNALVDAYRKGRVEIEHVDELPCRSCRRHVQSGGVQRLLPCDECGAVDEGEPDDDELLELADQKHEAQMMDLTPEEERT